MDYAVWCMLLGSTGKKRDKSGKLASTGRQSRNSYDLICFLLFLSFPLQK